MVADIDDMGPGITGNEISDNPGLAIDTSNIYAFNYESGTGSQVGNGGTYGIHALGGPLFTDGTARLYVLSIDAELFRFDPGDVHSFECTGDWAHPHRRGSGLVRSGRSIDRVSQRLCADLTSAWGARLVAPPRGGWGQGARSGIVGSW